MRSCAAVTLVLMLLLFGIPWLAEAPEGGQAPSEPLAAEELRADADIALTVWDGQELRQMTMAEVTLTHSGQILFQNICIAVLLPKCIRHQHSRVRPADGTVHACHAACTAVHRFDLAVLYG